uniref:Uncharacterized protein n=1 Tax=Oryza punctata TaxID=4537 RepID=A0A0E0LJ66_ORYPU
METSSASASDPPPLRRRRRRLVFDRRYGWMYAWSLTPRFHNLSLSLASCSPSLRLPRRSFDDWTDPADTALAGGRGMFCVLPMARSLVDVAVSSVTYAADSVSRALKRSGNSSPVAYLLPLSLHRKQQTWFRELEHVGVIADTKLIPCTTLCSLGCISTDGH